MNQHLLHRCHVQWITDMRGHKAFHVTHIQMQCLLWRHMTRIQVTQRTLHHGTILLLGKMRFRVYIYVTKLNCKRYSYSLLMWFNWIAKTTDQTGCVVCHTTNVYVLLCLAGIYTHSYERVFFSCSLSVLHLYTQYSTGPPRLLMEA